MLRIVSDPLTSLLNSARAGVARERGVLTADGDLHPTVLVNEIFLRIGRNPPRAWDSRRHFFGAVSQACEQVLVDLARARQTLKRGAGKQ
ncbi:MAG: ECF-type sigma factor, partial [bacterium]